MPRYIGIPLVAFVLTFWTLGIISLLKPDFNISFYHVLGATTSSFAIGYILKQQLNSK